MRAAFAAVILACAGAVGAQSGHVSWTVENCLSCHKPSEVADLAPRLTRPCRTLCLSCHKAEGHHPVGVAIPAPVAPPLLITKSGTNTCATCHDLARPAVESEVWTSQSLIQMIARRTKENKTYYLVTRNDHGQICRNCH